MAQKAGVQRKEDNQSRHYRAMMGLCIECRIRYITAIITSSNNSTHPIELAETTLDEQPKALRNN